MTGGDVDKRGWCSLAGTKTEHLAGEWISFFCIFIRSDSFHQSVHTEYVETVDGALARFSF
jgi:hypothetical protein